MEAKNNEISHLYPIIQYTVNKLDRRYETMAEDNLLRMVTNEEEDKKTERTTKIPVKLNMFKKNTRLHQYH